MNTSGPTFLLSVMMSASAISHAQTTPICASASSYVWFTSEGPPPSSMPISTAPTRLHIRHYAASGASYDFTALNVVVSGNGIALDALGVAVPGPTFPTVGTSIGTLPAGTYSVTIRPIATNVTPNVLCPTFTAPITVAAGFVAQAVPAISAGIAAMLAALLAGLGALGLRKRRSSHAR